MPDLTTQTQRHLLHTLTILGSSSSKKKPSPGDEEPAAPSHNLVIELHKRVQTDIIGFECVSILNAPHSPSIALP